MAAQEMILTIAIVGALVILYALLRARAWQRDYQRAIEIERAVRLGRWRT